MATGIQVLTHDVLFKRLSSEMADMPENAVARIIGFIQLNDYCPYTVDIHNYLLDGEVCSCGRKS